MQSTRYYKANPKLKINTEVLGTAAAPEVVFKLIDDTVVSSMYRIIQFIYDVFISDDDRFFFRIIIEFTLPLSLSNEYFCFTYDFDFVLFLQKRFDSRHYTANEIFFDVHLSLENLNNEFEMSGKSLDD